MSNHDAFEDEMNADARIFLEAIARELPERPDPQLEADLVSRMAAIARAEPATIEAKTAPRPRLSLRVPQRFALPARIAMASFGLVLSMAGLAVAGVALPGPIDTGFTKAGVDLPNQDGNTGAGEPAEPAIPGPKRGKEDGPGGANGPGAAGNGRGGKKQVPPGRQKGSGNPGNGPVSPGSQGNGSAYSQGNAHAPKQPRPPKAKPAKPAKPSHPEPAITDSGTDIPGKGNGKGT